MATGWPGFARIADNVEVFAPSNPIFALSGADTFVFAQPIGRDVVYRFDPAQDKINLIGFAGFSSFAAVLAGLSSDAYGNAVLTLGEGMSITFDGVATGSHALVIDTGLNVVINSGTLAATGAGGLIVLSAVENTGLIWAGGGNVSIAGSVTGEGDALISDVVTVELAGLYEEAGFHFVDNGAGGALVGYELLV